MAAQAKFHVACKPLALKDRVFALHSRYLHYAATNKPEEAKATVSVVADSIVKAASSQSLVVSRTDHLRASMNGFANVEEDLTEEAAIHLQAELIVRILS
ncbi:hypothetical protein ACKVWC_007728 [Pyricularia oryzae]